MQGSSLLDTMTAQVVAECDSNLSDARIEADTILADARSQSQAQRDAVQAATAREMEHLDERWKQMAHAEASRADLVVKSDAVNAVLDSAQAEVRALVNSNRFGNVIDALLESLMKEVVGDVVVVGPATHKDHVKLWLANNGHASVAVESSPEMWDGVAIQDLECTYRISNTLTGRYHRIENSARKHCMVTMFGEGAE